MTPTTMDAPTPALPPPAQPDVTSITRLPDTGALTKNAHDLRASVLSLGTVRNGVRYLDTKDQREEASLLKAGAAKIRKTIEAEFKKPKDALNTLKGWVLDREKECLDLPQRIEAECNRLCVEWDERQREIARRQEEDERRERARIAEEERLRQAEETRRQLLNEGAPVEEAEKAALDVVSQPIEVGHVPVAPEIPRTKGEVVTEYWKYEITDAAAVPREFCEPSHEKLQAHAKGFKSEAKVPGVRFFKETKISHRGARAAS